MLMGTLGQDLRYALRNLGKTPGFAIVAMITLALGIGASTAIFSVIDNILMEPFPYPDAQRFMSVLIHDTERSEPGVRRAVGHRSADRSIGIMCSRIMYLNGRLRTTGWMCCTGQEKGRSASTGIM